MSTNHRADSKHQFGLRVPIFLNLISDETIVHSERVNLNINPTNRLNKLTQHAQSLLEGNFSGWSAKDRISSNFDRLNEKMLSAYNRCGGGADANDEEDKKSGKGESLE